MCLCRGGCFGIGHLLPECPAGDSVGRVEHFSAQLVQPGSQILLSERVGAVRRGSDFQVGKRALARKASEDVGCSRKLVLSYLWNPSLQIFEPECFIGFC